MLEEVCKKKVNSTFLISVYCFEITGVEKKNYFCIFVCFFLICMLFTYLILELVEEDAFSKLSREATC